MNDHINEVKGFTLVEMAVVLVILALLLGGLLVPLSTQMDMKNYSQVKTDLEQIKEALYGYATVNGNLPCPDTSGDGLSDSCSTILNTDSTGGNLPWVTLGVQGNDPWNRPYQYRMNNAFSTTFSLTATGSGNGILRVCTSSACTATDANNIPAVIYSSGKNGATQPPTNADELENRTTAGPTFDRTFVNHEFTPSFDDAIAWISPNILFNRMVAAGRLP